MKVVTAIIGSPNKDSETRKYVESLLDHLDAIIDIPYEKNIIALSDYTVNMCKGCLECFYTCKSCTKYEDDLNYIETILQKSDVIIFASPVYAHNVPGIMKNFIDRISYGLHIMRLLGKYGITIAVSANNGNQFVNAYLAKIMLYLGVKVVGQLSFQLIKEKKIDEIEECAKCIRKILYNKSPRLASEYEELTFQTMKEAMEAVAKICKTKEVEYWMKNGFFNEEKYETLFENAINK